MDEFKFSAFFGISAPMAVLMSPAKFTELISGMQNYTGVALLDKLCLELQIFKDVVVNHMELPTTVDLESPEYKAFNRGLRFFISKKFNPELELPVRKTSSAAQSTTPKQLEDLSTSAFAKVQEQAARMDREDSSPRDSEVEVKEATEEQIQEPAEQVKGSVEQIQEPDDFFNFLFQEDSLNTPNQAKSETTTEDMCSLGEMLEEDTSCPVPLNTYGQTLMFFSKASGNPEVYNMTPEEVSDLETQFNALPTKYTGQVVITSNSEDVQGAQEVQESEGEIEGEVGNGQQTRTIDLGMKDPYVFQVIKALQEQALSGYGNQTKIDYLITQTQTAINNTSIETHRYMGLTWNFIKMRGPIATARVVRNLIGVESSSGEKERLKQFILECEELLHTDTSNHDINLMYACKFPDKLTSKDLSKTISPLFSLAYEDQRDMGYYVDALNESYNCSMIREQENIKVFQELQDDAVLESFLDYLKLLLDTHQIRYIFQSCNTTKHMFLIYQEIIGWTNSKWLGELGLYEVEESTQIGKEILIGNRKYFGVPKGFSIDDLTEELCDKYDIVGVSTHIIPFYESAIRLVGSMKSKEKRTLDKTKDSDLINSLFYILLHLRSTLYRRTHKSYTLVVANPQNSRQQSATPE